MPGTKKPVSRLTDILTKEVSLVDRAANKRTFILTKSDTPEGGELVPDAGGGFKTSEPAVPGVSLTKATRDALVSAIEKLTTLANGSAEGTEDNAEVTKAIQEAVAQFVPVPVPAPVTKSEPPELKADRKAVHKAAMGCAAKLLEIAQALSIEPTEGDETWPSGVRYKICDVLDSLVTLANLEAYHPAAAAMVAAAVGTEPVAKSDAPPAVPEPAAVDVAKYRSLAAGLHNTLASALGIKHDTAVTKASFDIEGATQLLEKSATVIKALQDKIAKLEALPVSPNALPVEGGTTAPKSDEVVWPMDMAETKEIRF